MLLRLTILPANFNEAVRTFHYITEMRQYSIMTEILSSISMNCTAFDNNPTGVVCYRCIRCKLPLL